MQVLIPAGGRGIRLQPLTTLYPKPLLPLGDRPILTRIVESLPRDLPVTVLITSRLEETFRRWRESLPGARRVRLYVEPPGQQGQAGPVSALASCVAEWTIADDLFILMGDSLPPFTLEQFSGPGLNSCPRLAAYALPDLREASRFGVLEISQEGTLLSFEEKPPRPRSPWVFTGCFYLPRRLLPALQRLAAGQLPQMGDLVTRFLSEGERIEVRRVAGEWHDIGTFESYLRAHQSLLSERQRQRLLRQRNQLNGSVYVHPSATVRDSRLTDCIVFAGARVIGAELTNCVVQPNLAILNRAIEGKVITRECELPFVGN